MTNAARAAANRRDRPRRHVTRRPRQPADADAATVAAVVTDDRRSLPDARGRDDLAAAARSGRRAGGPDRYRRVRRRRVQEGQERAHQRAHRQRRLPGRRRPRDDGRHGRPPRGRAGCHRPPARGRRADRRGDPRRRGRPLGRRADGDDRRHGVELVEVGLPNPFLERGIALVDTPGVGGLNAAHAAATLAFLPSADALVFVTDASTELSRPELEFLPAPGRPARRSSSRSPRSTSTRQWRRIVEHRRGPARRRSGSSDAPFPLSSVLRAHALATGDDDLETESGYPAFAEALADDAVGRRRGWPLSTAIAQVLPALDQLREPLAAERHGARATRTPPRPWPPTCAPSAHRLAALAEADARGRSASRTSSPRCGPGPAFAFQARMRQLHARRPRTRSSGSTRPRAWPEVGQRIQAETAAAVRAAFLEATDGAAAIQATIAAAPRRRGVSGSRASGSAVSFDVTTLWQGGPTFEGRAKSGVMASLGHGRRRDVSASRCSGMLGTLARGGGRRAGGARRRRVFGGKQVLDERRRQLADRRQQARAFLGDVPRGGPVRGRRPARVAPRRRPAPDACPVRRPDPRAPPDLRRDRGGPRKRDEPWPNPRASARLADLAAELAEIDELPGPRRTPLDDAD